MSSHKTADHNQVNISPFGERAALVVLGEEQVPELNNRVHALAAKVRDMRVDGLAFGLPVPAYSSLLVPYDPLALDFAAVSELLRSLLAVSINPDAVVSESELVEIPTRYGGEGGPDLAEVAAYHNITPDKVIELHTAAVYRVYMLGFAPGFAYLGPLPKELETPRRASPRTRVPVGSVAIAGAQTGVYPLATPGGWQLIGHTDAKLWDPSREQPALLKPGDYVRFVAV